MLDTLITSKTRIKLLLKFFLNPQTSAYLRSLSEEFGDSTNAIRLELNRFEEAGMLTSSLDGNRRIFKANIKHPLFKDVHNMLLKFTGIDQIIERIVDRLGNVIKVYVDGSLARGIESEVIDLVLFGEDIDRQYLTKLIDKLEPLLGKHIRYLLLNEAEEENYLQSQKIKPLLIWNHE